MEYISGLRCQRHINLDIALAKMTATNMLGVCTPGMQFVYAFPSWEGFVADRRVLRDAINRKHGLKVPHGKVFNMYRNFKELYRLINL